MSKREKPGREPHSFVAGDFREVDPEFQGGCVTKDLWTQLRDAREEDPHGQEQEEHTQRLRSEREAEREAELPHPQCCDQGRKYLFAFRLIDYHTDTILNDGVPVWQLSFRSGWKNAQQTMEPVTFCPFCGKTLPPLVKKAQPPPHMCQEDDGYCARCGERLGHYGYCFCSYPESAFEASKTV